MTDQRRSKNVCVVQLSNEPVIWCSKRHIAASVTARHVSWLRHFLKDFGFACNTPYSTFYIDNTAAIYWAKEPVLNNKYKHIETKSLCESIVEVKQILCVICAHSSANCTRNCRFT